MIAPLRHVIFDCDGTLVDSQHIICAAMERAFSAVELPSPSRIEVLSIVGLSLPEAMARLAPDVDREARDTLAAAYKDAFGSLRSNGRYHEPLFPGARTVMETLVGQPQTVLSMATGKSRRGVAAILALHDLEGVFHSLHTADDGPSKPHPDMIEKAIAASGVEARRAVMVGDTTYDIEMARAAGAVPVGVDWGYHPAERLADAGAVAVLTRFEDLIAVLDDHVPA